MKISKKNIAKIAKNYQIIEDDATLKSLEAIVMVDHQSFVEFSFASGKRQYYGLFGIDVDRELFDEIFDGKYTDLQLLDNPLDSQTGLTMPFLGKSVILAATKQTKQRLDHYLASSQSPEITRSLWQKHIKAGRILVNGQPTKLASTMVGLDDEITIDIEPTEITDQELPIIYENDQVVAFDKPPGMLTHSKGSLNDEFTVATAIGAKVSHQTETNRDGIVHRLDRDTSGVIVTAKDPETAKFIQKQFSNRTVKKSYLAVVSGHLAQPAAMIDLPIGRNPKAPSTFRVDPSGKSAQTEYQVLASNQSSSLLLLRPRTGRTHQLRVHLAYLGHPIVGDRVYGKPGERLMLHAWSLELTLPGGDRRTLRSQPAKGFTQQFPDFSGNLDDQ